MNLELPTEHMVDDVSAADIAMETLRRLLPVLPNCQVSGDGRTMRFRVARKLFPDWIFKQVESVIKDFGLPLAASRKCEVMGDYIFWDKIIIEFTGK